MASRGRIVVLHFAGQMPMGGIAWQAMQYVLGLERLGFEAWYVEDHGANPYDPRIGSVVMECDDNVAFVKRMMERHGLGGRWAYWDAINDVYHGLSREAVHRLYRESDALINLCGAVRLREEHMACPVRIMVDTDPVYEQIKYAEADPAARAYLDAHTHFFTYGENVGGPGWIVPLCGIPWQPTRPPVVLEEWPTDDEAPECFSTIATWENKGKNISFGGETYIWSKHINFLRFLDIPRRSGGCFTMAMLPPTPEIAAQVTEQGWRLADPRIVSASMESYAAFICGSRGEFTVAKDIYVRPNSGWFSDRSVCYLAAGRPVITMRTGFSRFYPVGEGLLDYGDTAEAVEAIAAVNRDYRRHSRAARMIAAEYFASDRVISELMSKAGFEP
jgi:glycosyltransferase involved in cell wall biosynthesis